MPIFRYIPKPFNGSPEFTVDVADEAAAIADVGLGNFDEIIGFTTMEPNLYANQFVNTKSVSREGDYYFGIDKLAPAVAAGMIKTSHAAVIISEQIEPPYNILVKQKGTGEAFISGVLIGETVPDGGDCTIAASGTFTSQDIGLVITDQEVGAYVYINDEGDLTWNNDSARALGWLLANDIFYIDVAIYNGMCTSPGDGFITAKGLHLDQSSAAGHGVEFINSSGNVVGRIHSDNDSGTNKLKISASSNESDGCQVVFTNRDGNNLMDINPDDNFVGMNHNRLTDIKNAEYPGDAANFSQIQGMINYQSGYHKLNVGGGSTTRIEYWQNGYYFKMSTPNVEVRLLEGSSEENPTCYAKYQQSTKMAYIKFFDRSGNLMNKSYHPHELMPEQTMEIFGVYGSNDYLVSISSVHPASAADVAGVTSIEESSEGQAHMIGLDKNGVWMHHNHAAESAFIIKMMEEADTSTGILFFRLTNNSGFNQTVVINDSAGDEVAAFSIIKNQTVEMIGNPAENKWSYHIDNEPGVLFSVGGDSARAKEISIDDGMMWNYDATNSILHMSSHNSPERKLTLFDPEDVTENLTYVKYSGSERGAEINYKPETFKQSCWFECDKTDYIKVICHSQGAKETHIVNKGYVGRIMYNRLANQKFVATYEMNVGKSGQVDSFMNEIEQMEIAPGKIMITGLENPVNLDAENTRYFVGNGRNDTQYQREFKFYINVSGRGAFEVENHCDYYPPTYPEILVYLVNESGRTMGGVRLGVGQGSNIRYDTSITDVQGFSDGYFVTPIHLWYKKNLSTSSALLFSEVSAGSEAKEIITKEFVYRFENESEFQKAVTLPDNVFAYVDHIIKIDGTKLKNVEFDQEYSDGAIRVILSELCSGVAIIKAIKYES